jgi:hypothetical protein
MADEKLVECELLADGMVVDGADAHRGDAIKIPESHYKSLLKHGSVGPKGTIKRQEQIAAQQLELDAQRQRIAMGLDVVTASEDSVTKTEVRRPVS